MNRIQNLSRQTVLIFLFGALAGCSYVLGQKDPSPLVSSPANSQKAEGVGFATVSEKVIGPRCLECHSAHGGNAGGVNLETYESTFPLLQSIREDVATARMPKNRALLSGQEKEILFAWIDSGGPRDDQAPSVPAPTPTPQPLPAPTPQPLPGPAPTPAPGAVTFAMVQKQVFQPSCVGCHSQNGRNPGGVNLETFSAAFAVRDRIQNEVAGGTMPPRNPLSASQKDIVLQWIAEGSPQ